MKQRVIFIITIGLCCIFSAHAQNSSNVFSGKIYNKEYKVWIEMDFINKNISIPQQEEILGEVSGYIGHETDPRKWIIVEADVHKQTAKLSIINDYGSEDLEATLSFNRDSTFTLVQKEGSSIKFAVNRKWQKLPKQLVFIR